MAHRILGGQKAPIPLPGINIQGNKYSFREQVGTFGIICETSSGPICDHHILLIGPTKKVIYFSHLDNGYVGDCTHDGGGGLGP